MNNYLHSLPFQKDAKRLSNCVCPQQGFDPPSFKLYSEADRFPTFVLRLPPIGDQPDLSYAKECIRVQTCDGKNIASVTMEDAGVDIYKDSISYYIIYDGRAIPGVNLECGSCYRLRIANNYSEVFWITQTPDAKIRLEFSNEMQLGDVPYQTEFTQKLLIDGEICSLDAEMFENRKTEANGKETISYQRMTLRKGLQIFNAPDFVSQLLIAAGLHDSFKVFNSGEEFLSLKKRVKVEPRQNGCCDYDIEVTLPLRDIEIIGGNCQTDVDSELTEVEIPDDLPDSCSVDDDFEPTDEVICLKNGQTPPPIDAPITPVGTPPLPPPCPPANFLLSRQTFSVDCLNPWIKDGVKYKTKVTEVRANGTCGETSTDLFYDSCADLPQDTGSILITNAVCTGVGTPPVGTPPVGTPPVGTPPVGTPPVGTPPGTSPCIRRPTITGIPYVTNNALDYNFDGEGVFSMKWAIQQGAKLRDGIVSPTNSTVHIDFDALPDGSYVLEVEGNNCTSEKHARTFSIETAENPPVQAGISNGQRIVQIGDTFYKIINSELMSFEVLPTNRVRLNLPGPRPSFNGQSTVESIVLGKYWEDLKYNNPTKYAELISSQGTEMHDFTTLTAMDYPAKPSIGRSLREISEKPSGLWITYGNQGTELGPQNIYSNNSGQVQRAVIYRFKQSGYSELTEL